VDRRIGEVLAYARPRPLEITEFELGGLLAGVIEQVRARFPQGPDPVLAPCPGIRLRADAGQLGQAVENLLVNAAEAAGPEGQVRLLVQAGKERSGLRLLVRNTGPQLKPERIKEIFEPFRTDKSRGTGLGLPLARRIIGDHGGRISALSAGGWTTFVVALPADVPAGWGENHGDEAGTEVGLDAVG
jgi:signal transduction histidine kinase